MESLLVPILLRASTGGMGNMRPVRLRLVRLGLRVISAFTLPQ